MELEPTAVCGWENLPLALCGDCAGRIDRVAPVMLDPGMNVVAVQEDQGWRVLKGRLARCWPTLGGYRLSLNYGGLACVLRADQPVAIMR
jgi:hypothetical protein